MSETARITKLEAHIRFAVDYKQDAIKTLDHSRDLIGWGGNAEIEARQQRAREGWVEAGLTSNRWDLLGFEKVDYKEFAKVYQAQNWHKKPESDPFHHPKLEVAYAGGAETHPPLDAWDDVLHRLRRKVCEHAKLAGITPADLVPDRHYDAAGEPTMTYERTDADRQDDLRAFYDDLGEQVRRLVSPRDSAHDVLEVVARHAGATYDQLASETGLARRTVRYHVRKFEEAGIVERVGNPVTVVFAAEYLLERVEEILESMHAGETVAERRKELEDRAEERRQRREKDSTDEETDADEDAESGQQRDRWEYLEDLPELSPVSLSDALVAGPLDGEDVRIRVRNLPPGYG